MFEPILAQLAVVAVFVQRVIEAVKFLYKEHEYEKYFNIAISVALSAVLCVLWQIDVFVVAGITFPWVWLGQALTGLFAGLGSNVLNDLLELLKLWKEQRKVEILEAKEFLAEPCRDVEG